MKTIEHPGFYLASLLKKNGMSQKELAIRTGVSEKHICTIIAKERSISAAFAHKLKYVFGNSIDWIELQNKYDAYQQRMLDKQNISSVEIEIVKQLKEPIKKFIKLKKLKKSNCDADFIIGIRSLLQVSDLAAIADITYNAAYRAQISKNALINPFVLYAWQRLCEVSVESVNVKSLDIEGLKRKIIDIKNLMFNDFQKFIPELKEIFSSCGIAFNVVDHFKGAPVQGFIKESQNKVILCLTNRRKRADVFWFTLFHEIGHLVNGDFKNRFVDFELADNETEKQADEYARDLLIPVEEYKKFVQKNDNFTKKIICNFAEKIGVMPFIVVGRLQNDHIIDWSEHTDLIINYSNKEE